jgi:hypothetical protein
LPAGLPGALRRSARRRGCRLSAPAADGRVNRRPQRDAIEDRITFAESLRLRVGAYAERDPRGRRFRSASTSS